MAVRSPLTASLPVAFATAAVGLAMLSQEMLVASTFSAGTAVDAYQLAAALPVAAINIFAGGTVQSLLVPNFVRLELSAGPAAAVRLLGWARRALSVVLAAAILLLVALFLTGSPRVATGFSADTLAHSRRLFWDVLPLFYFGGLASLDVAALNSVRALTLAALLPAITPLSAVVAVTTVGSSLGIAAVAWGASTGAVIQFLLARTILRRMGYGTAAAGASAGNTSHLSRGYWQLAAAATLLGGIMITDVSLAATLEPGSAATFGFASRPVMLGLAFLTVVASNVALPHFSGLAAQQDWNGLRRSYLGWASLLLVLSLPVVAICYLFAGQVTALLYQRGAFGPAESAKVGAVLRLLILQVPFYLTAMIGLRVANAIGKNRVLLLIALLCFSLNLLLGLLLVGRYGLEGVAVAMVTTFAAWAGLVTFYVFRLCRVREA